MNTGIYEREEANNMKIEIIVYYGIQRTTNYKLKVSLLKCLTQGGQGMGCDEATIFNACD